MSLITGNIIQQLNSPTMVAKFETSLYLTPWRCDLTFDTFDLSKFVYFLIVFLVCVFVFRCLCIAVNIMYKLKVQFLKDIHC